MIYYEHMLIILLVSG